jgi:hypothetical protein
MGVIYMVTPFSTLSAKDLADMRKYLAENGIEFPPAADRSCFPTQNEIEKVLLSFNSYEIRFYPDGVARTFNPWRQVSIFKRASPGSGYTYSESTDLVSLKPIADKDSPCDFYFSKGSEHLNYLILERLAYECGPLLCVTDGECDAVIFHRKQSALNPPPSFAESHHLRSSQS